MSLHALLQEIKAFEKKQQEDVAAVERKWRDFGETVRQTRKQRNIALATFSRKLGVSKSMTGFLESGKRRWNLGMAKRAVEILTNE